jgi:aromatic ring-cleaving dioxygenase
VTCPHPGAMPMTDPTS